MIIAGLRVFIHRHCCPVLSIDGEKIDWEKVSKKYWDIELARDIKKEN